MHQPALAAVPAGSCGRAVARDIRLAGVPAEVEAVAAADALAATPTGTLVQRVAKPDELVFHKRVEGVEDEGADGGRPRFVLPLWMAGLPSPVLRPSSCSVSTSPTWMAGVRCSPHCRIADSRTSDATMGKRKHSVLPDPVPGRYDDIPAVDIRLLKSLPLVSIEAPGRREEALLMKPAMS